ncbi:MAG: thiol:disulfide interchange protein DsbA/DsbL [Rubrivivax sp.]|nr:thiol:disulfide interchange protein DsbA/DsbL [Rubrivivax sp.]MDH5339157.1 thiol:disulfide interchange protein DsbA/DsbL [Rubrivivax sp.]
MKRRDFSVTVAAGLGGLIAGPAWAQAPVEGRNYVRLSQPAPVSLPSPDKKVDVVEFFWYECPHCYAFEPAVSAWARKLPPQVSFRQVPVGFTARHQVAQKAFFAFQEMGVLETMHARTFAAIHVQRQRLMTEKAYIDFAAANGVDAEKFAAAMNSFSVNMQANRARQLSDAYKIDGVPAMGVQGRFYTSGSLAGSNEQALSVVDYLIQQVSKGG